MAMAATRLDRVSLIALVAGAVWALGLIVSGFLVPVYRSTRESSSGEATHSTETLVGENGSGVVAVLAVPLAVTLAVASSLLLRSHRGALPTAWTLTVLLAVFNMLTMLSIGVFILPVTAALVVACAACSRTGAAVKV